MLLALALIFLLVHLLPVLAVVLMRPGGMRRDVFAPLYMVTALNLLNVPYLLLLAADRSYLSPDSVQSPWLRDLDAAVAGYVAVACVGFLALVAGMFSPLGPALARPLPRLDASRFTAARVYRAILVTAVAGVAAYLSFLAQIGGLSRLWLVLYNRTLVTAGTGYITYAYSLLFTFVGVLLAYSLRFRMTRARRAVVIVGMLGVAVVLASTGGRSGAVTVILFALMTVHYGVRRFRRLVTPGTAALAAVLFVFILVMPLFRTARSYERYTDRPDLLVADAVRSLGDVAPQFSAADRGMVIVGYFRTDRLWWGASYLDLLVAPVPRTLMPDKPPVDEGVYLTAIARGSEVRPSMPARKLPITALPMGTWIMYMNFGVVGWVAGMFLTGAVLAAAYRHMQRCGCAPHAVYLYGFVVLNGFSLSNMGLVNFIITVGFTSAVFWLLFGRTLPAFERRGPQRLAAAAG
ncbi:MAG TPA: O-antigen polymerase [Longimicrobium sp.]|nr:O-antigen polymerase [Longimicrobium sp.]